jgi:valyl-tRNA synthetase
MSTLNFRYTDVIATLSFSSSVSVSENPPTHGCAIVTVNDKCSAHIVLTGLIDPVKEVGRLEKKKTILSATVEKLEKAVKVDGYETKVPDDVKAANKEKMVQTRTEIDRLAEAIKALKVL